MLRVGFTGTREQITYHQKVELHNRISLFKPGWELHHGCCVGADTEAHLLTRINHLGEVVIHGHPPLQDIHLSKVVGGCDVLYPAAHYLDRNKTIVASTDCLIAVPLTDTNSVRSGTWSTVRYARALGRPILIIYPDGHVETEGRVLHVR